MRNSLFLLVIIILTSGCKNTYLPKASEIGMHPRGSLIKISVKNTANFIEGELIAVETQRLVVLLEDSQRCITIPVSDVIWYKLRYAKPSHYGWSIPVYTLATISHGFIALITLPFNLFTTIGLTVAGENDYIYTKGEMSYTRLKMFARFPQGLPPGIDLAAIR